MTCQCYLLSLEEFWEGADGEELLEAALEKVDMGRRKKAEGMRIVKARAACVGAGLLLQLAVQEALEANGLGDHGQTPVVYSVSQVLTLVKEPRELVMDHGEKGKPYLREYPLFFNLSHSGAYVFCAVSDRDVGVDIQQCTDANIARIAQRFFTERESCALAACRSEEKRRQLFFRLWARKEAYGKLLGEGILGAVSVNLLPDGEDCVSDEPCVGACARIQRMPQHQESMARRAEADQELCWQEWDWPEGYRIAVCQRAEKVE